MRVVFDDTLEARRASRPPACAAHTTTACRRRPRRRPRAPARQRRAVLLRHDRPLRERRRRPTTRAASPATALTTGYDPTDKGFYNGGDLAGLRAQLDYIDGLGTTAIWLTPSFKNRPVQGEGANASAGYHGYWITDFTQIDPHLGTNAELEALIAEAHAKGIKVYFDIITNHTADVIDYEEGQHSYIDQATSPYRDADGNAFDPGDYAGAGDPFPALDPATSFPYTPDRRRAEDADLKVPAWLNDPTLYHNRGDSTWEGESVTFGDFVGLDDLMTEHPTVVNGFVDVYEDWIDLGIDGFRIDTAKHVNFEFWEQWSTAGARLRRTPRASPTSSCSARSTTPTRVKLSPYVRNTDMNSVLDFTFQSQAVSFAAGNSAKDLQSLFAGDDYYTTPDSSATALPTFLGNHDMGRVGYFLQSTAAAAAARRARPRADVPHARPAGRLLRRRAGLRRHRRRQERPADAVRDAGRRVPEPAARHGRDAGTGDTLATDAPLYEHIAALADAARRPPGPRDRRADRALRRQRRGRLRVLPRRPRREGRVPRRAEQLDRREDGRRADAHEGRRVRAALRRRRAPSRRTPTAWHPSPCRRSAPSC